MSLDGIDPFDLALEDILIQREEKEGMAVANEGDITVALDLHLDADLKREGLAREMVHVIQNLRKENGFDVSDRITITYSGSDEVAGAVGQFQEYIQGETLCTSLERVDAVDGNAVDLEGHSVVFDVEKVA
jgi:isoleucyl-tRNA synthetase